MTIDISQHQGFLAMLCQRFRWAVGSTIQQDDLLSEANVAALKALKSFDVNHGNGWQAYVGMCVTNHLMRFTSTQYKVVGVPSRTAVGRHKAGKPAAVGRIYSMDDETLPQCIINQVHGQDDTPEKDSKDHDSKQKKLLAELQLVLTPREREIIQRQMAGEDNTQIAKHFGVSRQRILQIKNEALGKMRAAACGRTEE